MQLNDILEENSIKMISQRTKISEENLENLVAKKFENLKRIKTLGFISIIEREYKADLTAVRDEAYEYYGALKEDRSVTLGRPVMEEKKGTSKLFLLSIFLLLGYVTWYFLTQFDKKHLSQLIPFIDEETIESFVGKNESPKDIAEDLSIVKVTTEAKKVEEPEIPNTQNTVEEVNRVEVTQTVEDITPAIAEVTQSISIVPVGRLWFGVINMETKQRDHFSISEPYSLDIGTKSWLVATSSAPFALVGSTMKQEYNDAQEHYFKIDNEGIRLLSKDEYVTEGGWNQW